MGTRGLIGHIVRSRNLQKASYNRFDSCPSGLGAKIAAFITSLNDEQIANMAERLGQVTW